MSAHTIILEQASLELVPKKFWGDAACVMVEKRFGIPPEHQILDDNFHHGIVEKLPQREKRGRPDIVHFALLDIVSTPVYLEGLIQPVIHTLNDEVIILKERVRIPRTELRFNGVMSKILRREFTGAEENLFEKVYTQDSEKLIKSLDPNSITLLSTQGLLKDLRVYLGSLETTDSRTQAWIIGGFARGHFDEEIKALATEMVSISDRSLAAHVVSARLSYELERSMKTLQRS